MSEKRVTFSFDSIPPHYEDDNQCHELTTPINRCPPQQASNAFQESRPQSQNYCTQKGDSVQGNFCDNSKDNREQFNRPKQFSSRPPRAQSPLRCDGNFSSSSSNFCNKSFYQKSPASALLREQNHFSPQNHDPSSYCHPLMQNKSQPIFTGMNTSNDSNFNSQSCLNFAPQPDVSCHLCNGPQPFPGLGSHRMYPAVAEQFPGSSSGHQFLKPHQLAPTAAQNVPKPPQNYPIHDQVFKMINNPCERSNFAGYSQPPQPSTNGFFRLPSLDASINEVNSSSRLQFKKKPISMRKTLFDGLEEHDESMSRKMTVKNSSPKKLIIGRKK